MGRRHNDPQIGRPATARPPDANAFTPRGDKVWTPRSAFFRSKLMEYYRPEPHDVRKHGHVIKDCTGVYDAPSYSTTEGSTITVDVFDDTASDPGRLKPGFTRTHWGTYYRDPDRGMDQSAR